MKLVKKMMVLLLLVLLGVPVTALGAGSTNGGGNAVMMHEAGRRNESGVDFTAVQAAASDFGMHFVKNSRVVVEMASVRSPKWEPETEESSEEESTGSSKKRTSGVISTDEFEIRVICGLEGNYRRGAAIPVTIYIESKRQDFEGLIRMIVPGNRDEGTIASAYEKDVMLTAGVQKIITMSMSTANSMSTVYFELEDQSGRIVEEQGILMKSQSNESALVGILSDDYTALNYFDKQHITLHEYSGMVQLLELNADTFPDQPSGLDALSYLIINSFDTSRLTEGQYLALKNWVERGGVLIVGTGPDYQQTLSAFQDGFVEGGKISGMKDGSLVLSGPVHTGQEEEEGQVFTEKQGVLDLTLAKGVEVKDVLADTSLIWRQSYGDGNVVITAFNLGMEPVVSWGGRQTMAKYLLEASAYGASATRIESLNYGNYKDTWAISTALDELHEIKDPNVGRLSLILGIFVVVSGLLLYLILKMVDKRELLWIMVPVLAVVFTAAIFISSWDIRIRNPLSASITSLYAEEGMDGDEKQEVSLAVLVPDTGRIDIRTDRSLINMRLYSDYYYDYGYYNSGADKDIKDNYRTAVKEGADGYQIGIRNDTTFSTSYMGFDRVSGENTIAQNLKLNLKKHITGISGTITNDTGYDLEGVCVMFSSKIVMIGRIKDGETKEIRESDSKMFRDFDSYSMPKIAGLEDDPMLYRRVLNTLNMVYYQGINSELYTNQMSTYILGVISQWDADYIADDKIVEKNQAVVVKRADISYTDYPDSKLFPLYDFLEEHTGEWDSDGQMYSNSAEVTFDLRNQTDKIFALIRARDTEAQYGNTKNVKMYAWNWKTEAYEALFTKDIIEEFDKGKCPYLSKERKVRIRFECQTPYEDYSPMITVVGGK